MSNTTKLVAAAVATLSALAYLAFGVFGVHTLFIDDTVDEAGPVFSSTVDAEVRQDLVPDRGETVESSEPSLASDAAAAAAEEEEEVVEAEVLVLVEGEFVGLAHPSTGVASVIGNGTDQRFLRFEGFEVDNGPDLFVYLTTEDAAGEEAAFGREGEFVDLGTLTGNIGSQNYEIPSDVDLDVYNTVVIWCRRFSVAFAAADLV